MLVIPAIDLKDGKCVRLRQGKMDDETVYSADPLSIAQQWVDAGARRLHVVDLDGAVAGKPVNAPIIHRIAEAFPDLPIQVGGGIRDEDTIQAYLGVGVQYVIIGTKAINEPHFVDDVCLKFPDHILVGLDAKDGKVAIDGWSTVSHHGVVDMAQRFESSGVTAIIFTDISRDGMMSGVNFDSTVEIAKAIHIPVIASGGVTNLDDIRKLCGYQDEGVMGVITGRAIYEGSLDFGKAQQLADELC